MKTSTAQTLAGPSATDGRYDVAILGTGMAGSLLGLILARHGARVLLLDAGTHPRFAVGESTVPATSRMVVLLGERYDIPEIKHISSFREIRSKITSSCGIKTNFGFVYHHMDGRQDPTQTDQVVVNGKLIDHETHLFRQDIDAYLMQVAVKYGADARQQVRVTDLEIDGNGVTLATASGETFEARYLVDAAGFRSPLAQKMNLRENPSRLLHHSRTVFTHMVDVKHYDECIHPRGCQGNPERWSQGTLHHVFEGGWFWIIPFDNHPQSTNPLCSVGVTVDFRKYPKPTCSPEEDFYSFVNLFPSVREQFRSARAVREWVSTDRLQYSSRQTIGDRFCLMAHAAGFIDPLFSRGLASTVEVVNVLADRLLTALKDDDFSRERFEFVEQIEQLLLDYNDRLVHYSFVSFSHYELWHAWLRVWAVGQGIGELNIIRVILDFQERHDPAVFRELEKVPYPGLLCPFLPAYKELWEGATGAVSAFEAGRLTGEEAAATIWALLERLFSDPVYLGFHLPSKHFLGLEPLAALKGLAALPFRPRTDIHRFLLNLAPKMMKRFALGGRL